MDGISLKSIIDVRPVTVFDKYGLWPASAVTRGPRQRAPDAGWSRN